MMRFVIFSGAQRNDSETIRVCGALSKMLVDLNVEPVVVDLYEKNLSLNLDDIWSNKDGQGDIVKEISDQVASADGIVLVTPEYSGMASPSIKAMLNVVKGFAHKPALIVSVSSSRGGSYPVAELRMSSYKNTKIVYIPDHLIVREVGTAFTGDGSSNDEYITTRAQFSLNSLVEYAKVMKPLRDIPELDNDEYDFGM